MKEPYGKGVASQPDPEPYAISREAGGGALARVRAGWVLSSEIVVVEVPTPSAKAEGNIPRIGRRDGLRPPGDGDPKQVRNHCAPELGDLQSAHG
jgi:hypothetical protein